MNWVAGVDGCRGGWVMVARAGRRAEVHFARNWRELPDWPATVAVDMPIGLSEEGPRACEPLARRLLGRGRASSVFPVPNRPMLDFDTWDEANAWGKARGRGLPRQSWGIMGKIRELDRVLDPADQARVHEAHPELAFMRLAGGTPPPPKRLPAGAMQRRTLLEAEGFGDLDDWRRRWPRHQVAIDDIYDACALCLTAERIRDGQAVRLPADPPTDGRGMRMEIWY
jgi:predicted RNase H-like nuclease